MGNVGVLLVVSAGFGATLWAAIDIMAIPGITPVGCNQVKTFTTSSVFNPVKVSELSCCHNGPMIRITDEWG